MKKITHISKKSKTIAATAFILGVAAVGAGAFTGNTAFADTTTTGTDPHAAHITNLITALSQKFNLNSTEVKTVIDTVMASEKTQMEAKRTEALAARLAKAVTDGKITAAQSALITAKMQENKTFMESLKGKTEAERIAAMKAHKESMDAWIKANNIPKEFIGGGMGMKGGRGPGMGKMGIKMDAPTTAPAQQ